jgi:hypothetical protein
MLNGLIRRKPEPELTDQLISPTSSYTSPTLINTWVDIYQYNVTIPKPPPRLILFHFLHLAYPNIPLCRFPIHLPYIHPLHPISYSFTGIYAMVYEMESGSYHYWSL